MVGLTVQWVDPFDGAVSEGLVVEVLSNLIRDGWQVPTSALVEFTAGRCGGEARWVPAGQLTVVG